MINSCLGAKHRSLTKRYVGAGAKSVDILSLDSQLEQPNVRDLPPRNIVILLLVLIMVSLQAT